MGRCKQRLYELIDAQLAEAREKYNRLLAHPDEVEDVLQAGAEKARIQSKELMLQVRDAVGLSSQA